MICWQDVIPQKVLYYAQGWQEGANCIISEAWRKSMSHFGPNMNILGTSLLFLSQSKGGAWLSNWQLGGPLGPGFPHWEDLQNDIIEDE